MTSSSIMVHMDVGTPNDAVPRVAAGLAGRFGANVVGIAAAQPVGDTDCYATADITEADRAEVARRTAEAEGQFRSALRGRCPQATWRSVNAAMSLAEYVAKEARAVDLVVTGPDTGFSTINSSRSVVVSDLVLQAGRPVLLVAPDADELDLRRVVVVWKDTREARRAIADALPLLALAGRVLLVEVVEAVELPAARAGLSDVAGWLGRHGVASDVTALASTGDDAAQLRAFAREHEASVVVAGAYGHGRLREWAFGGVTRHLLARPDRCALLSH